MPLYIPKDEYLLMLLNSGNTLDGDGMVRTTVSSKLCSDGHHTFYELYEHRYLLWIAYCQLASEPLAYAYVWRSKLHADGSMFEDSFVLGVNAIKGIQITYHLHLDKWSLCDFANTLDRAPKYDGHTPADVLDRLRDQIERRNK